MTETQIWEPTNEPNWKQIGWAYLDLAKTSQKLSDDVARYKAALMELDGAGTDIGVGRERIAEIREQINQLEKEAA